MPMTSNNSTGVLSRSGPALAVIGIHAVLIYGLVVSVGIVELPKVAQPIEAIFIEEPVSESEPEPLPEVKPEIADLPQIEQPLPDVPIQEVIVPPAEVAMAPSSSAVAATEGAGAVSRDLRTSNRVEPVYPPMSRRMGEEGTVRLRVLVDERGRPGDVNILKSSGFGRLDEAAVTAVRRWRFEPATDAGRPVRAWTQVAITFRLTDARG